MGALMQILTAITTPSAGVTALDIWWQLALLVAGSYLVGNINFALIISKLKKSDIRTHGSGNPGTMNMLRNFGLKLGLLTLVLDVLKGLLPTAAGYYLFRGVISETGFHWAVLTQYIAGLSTVVGHIFPVFLKFKGGKGIASTIGIFMFVQPLITVAVFLLILLYIYRFEFGSIGSMILVTIMSVGELTLYYIEYYGNFYPELMLLFALIFTLCFLCYYAHRSNIKRLILGMENRTPLRKMLRKLTGKKRKKRIAAQEQSQRPYADADTRQTQVNQEGQPPLEDSAHMKTNSGAESDSSNQDARTQSDGERPLSAGEENPPSGKY